MIKPAIFIDAYLSDDSRLELFNQNIKAYKDCGYDIYVISNKISHFERFSNLKYFEYDSENRILKDPSKYTLHSVMSWDFDCSKFHVIGTSLSHGFTNWTILYNLKKIALLLKKRGYTHLIRCEYDVVFKDYDLMKNIFKDYGITEKSKKCMILPGGFGVSTNFFLIDIDILIDKIPDMETEEDYLNFLIKFYGYNKSPVFEELFNNLLYDQFEFLDEAKTNENIVNVSCFLSGGDFGYRHSVLYGDLILTPIDDNQKFLFKHCGLKTVYIDFKTDNLHHILCIRPGHYLVINLQNNSFVEVKTSDMDENKVVRFDLNQPCKFKTVYI